MTDEDNALMKDVFGRIRACVPETFADGRFDETAQLIKVRKEYSEEIVDTMTALATLLWAHTRDASSSHRRAAETIEKVMDMVRIKNELRGYHDFKEEGEKSEEESRA